MCARMFNQRVLLVYAQYACCVSLSSSDCICLKVSFGVECVCGECSVRVAQPPLPGFKRVDFHVNLASLNQNIGEDRILPKPRLEYSQFRHHGNAVKPFEPTMG